MANPGSFFSRGLLAGVALWLAACSGGPIVASTPEQRYARANEQLAHGNYWAAVDTFTRLAQEAPHSEPGQRARLLRVSLLAGIARGLHQVGEAYLEGSRAAGEAAHASRMRSTAMDYFGRARGRSLSMVEALDSLLRRPLEEALRAEVTLPARPAEGAGVLDLVRRGTQVSDKREQAAEKRAVVAGLREAVTRLGTQPRAEALDYQPAHFYLAAAELLTELSDIYRPEALRNARSRRLYFRRAATLAERAGGLAEAGGQAELAERSRDLERRARRALE